MIKNIKRTRQAKHWSGGKDDFPPAGGVWGGMQGGGFLTGVFWEKNSRATKLIKVLYIYSIILRTKLSNSIMVSIYGK